MVHVYEQLTEQFNIVMEEQSGKQEEKRREQGDFLPSMGLGDLLTNPGDATKLMARIRNSDGMQLVASSDVRENERVQQSKPWSVGVHNTVGNAGRKPGEPISGLQQQGRVPEPQPGTSRDTYGYRRQQYGQLFTLTAGKTQPIGGTSTINMEHLNNTENEFKPDTKIGLLGLVNNDRPQLEVKTAEYARFRYASERPEKGKKTRQYEMDEEKRFMADVKISNYTGPATVIIHCVDSAGNLHPYHLDGEDCEKGVYYKRFECSPRTPVLKILKTTVIQPKAKEYEKSLADQRQFLTQNRALNGSEKNNKHITDKQCVHFHVKVFLDGRKEIPLRKITNAIRNKKDGTEFKIHVITPPSASASGTVLKHLGKSVIIVVTNETAFPKDVAVVFRDKSIQWEQMVKGNDIKVIKKAVIELIPPPYQDPNIRENVQVEICLRDCITKKETEPVQFWYIADQHGVHGKRVAKKRKYEELDEQASLYQSAFGEPDLQEQRRLLNALTNPGSENIDSLEISDDMSDSSGDNTPRNSLGFTQDDNINTVAYQTEVTTTAQAPVDVSLDERRANRGLGVENENVIEISFSDQTAQPSTSTMGQQPSTSGMGQSLNQLVNPMQNTQSSALSGVMFGEQFDANILQSLQFGSPSTSSGNEKLNFLEQLSPDMLMRLANLIKNKAVEVIPEFENRVWERLAKVFDTETSTTGQLPEQTAQVQPVAQNQQPQPVGPVQSLSDLPELPPECSYAIIKGQIVVVKNDIQEASTQAAGQSIDIAGQQVIIQQMDPVQPAEIPSDLLSSKTFNEMFGSNLTSGVLGNLSAQPSTSSQLSQPSQPPAAFWRARTGASSNLEDDDDVEIDSGNVPAASQNGSNNNDKINGDSHDMDVDETGQTSAKTHVMKLRGKKKKYKNALRDYEDALSDIKESGDAADEQEVESDNGSKYSKSPKRNSPKGKEKRNQRRGKAIYEDNSDADDDNETENHKNSSFTNGRGRKLGRGKDLRLVKKMAFKDDDENSQGFECSSQS